MPAQKNTQSTLKKDPEVQVVRPEALKILFTWEAPERLFKKRNREYFTTLGAIVFLLMVILFFLQEWFLIAVIIALSFFFYMMSSIEPQKTEHKLSNRGIISGGKLYPWGGLGRFWVKQDSGQKIMYVENALGFPRRLVILLGKAKESQVKEILTQYLLNEEPEKTWVDNASDWLSRRVPLESS